MTHGGQEGGLGLVCRFRLLLGHLHGVIQALAFGNVDPAGNHTGNGAVAATIGKQPVVQGQLPAICQGQHPITHHRLPLLYGFKISLAVVLRLFCGQHSVKQGLAYHLLAFDTQCLQIAQVAGQQAPFPVAHVNRVGSAIDHHPHEFQLVSQGSLRLVSRADQLAQRPNPQHRHQQQQAGHGKALKDDPAVGLPIAVGNDDLAAPAIGQLVHFLRHDTEQGLVEY
ncbi:hypothetical protein D3C76_912390 [compost metagenome]